MLQGLLSNLKGFAACSLRDVPLALQHHCKVWELWPIYFLFKACAHTNFIIGIKNPVQTRLLSFNRIQDCLLLCEGINTKQSNKVENEKNCLTCQTWLLILKQNKLFNVIAKPAYFYLLPLWLHGVDQNVGSLLFEQLQVICDVWWLQQLAHFDSYVAGH